MTKLSLSISETKVSELVLVVYWGMFSRLLTILGV